MKNIRIYLILVLFFVSFTSGAQENIYNFKAQDIEGNTFDFSEYEGFKILIVNTASKCGLTPQYELLEEVYKQHKDQKFVVIGFPSNDFMKQEPGSDEDIAAFCQKNYGVSFPMMSKVVVKGSEQCDIYNFLTRKERNGLEDADVKWNFQKYLIGRNGKLEKVISPKTLPNDPEILDWLVAE